MLDVISKPFPFSRGLTNEIAFVAFTGVAATVIFYVVRPFGLHLLPSSYLFGYGLVCVVSAIAFTVVSHWFYRVAVADGTWTNGYEIIRSSLLLLFVGASIMVYGNMVGITRLDLVTFFVYEFNTLLAGFVPIVIRTILVRNWRLKKELQEASRLTEYLAKRKVVNDEKILSLGQAPDLLEVSNHAIQYIEAAQNYVIVIWLENEIPKKKILRASMKEVHRQANDPLIVFCHRSYVINLRKVKKIVSHGGSHSLVLDDPGSVAVPLSNTYRKDISERLRDALQFRAGLT